jgi:mannose-1-phosphate guanylyltransferase
MKIIIFAGGVGTRLWPLSRKSFPKQFIKMFNGKSTIELAVNRVKSFGSANIYISTLNTYVPLVRKNFPKIPRRNIIGEPALRNVAPAIGYNLIRLRKEGYKGPVAILWADHLIKNEDNFVEILKRGEKLIKKDPNRLVFVGIKPRFANNNLGWIHTGKAVEPGAYKFLEWSYKPQIDKCIKMFKSKEWFWNSGYFIMDLDFALSLYEKLQPTMYKDLQKIEKSIGTKRELNTVKKIYPTLEKISFDNAIAEKVSSNQAVVVKADLGEWSDPGTLYALKEALIKKKEENLVKGNVSSLETKDSLLINQEKSKLLATVGLEGFIVVNTKDVILVVPKDKVREVSDLIKEIELDKKNKKYL